MKKGSKEQLTPPVIMTAPFLTASIKCPACTALNWFELDPKAVQAGTEQVQCWHCEYEFTPQYRPD